MIAVCRSNSVKGGDPASRNSVASAAVFRLTGWGNRGIVRGDVIMEDSRMARPKKQQATAEIKQGVYRIVEKDGKFILYHGASVRLVFATREKAVEYLSWVSK